MRNLDPLDIWGAMGVLLILGYLTSLVFTIAGFEKRDTQTVCREAGYYNTLESCKGVTYPKGDEDDR